MGARNPMKRVYLLAAALFAGLSLLAGALYATEPEAARWDAEPVTGAELKWGR